MSIVPNKTKPKTTRENGGGEEEEENEGRAVVITELKRERGEGEAERVEAREISAKGQEGEEAAKSKDTLDNNVSGPSSSSSSPKDKDEVKPEDQLCNPEDSSVKSGVSVVTVISPTNTSNSSLVSSPVVQAAPTASSANNSFQLSSLPAATTYLRVPSENVLSVQIPLPAFSTTSSSPSSASSSSSSHPSSPPSSGGQPAPPKAAVTDKEILANNMKFSTTSFPYNFKEKLITNMRVKLSVNATKYGGAFQETEGLITRLIISADGKKAREIKGTVNGYPINSVPTLVNLLYIEAYIILHQRKAFGTLSAANLALVLKQTQQEKKRGRGGQTREEIETKVAQIGAVYDNAVPVAGGSLNEEQSKKVRAKIIREVLVKVQHPYDKLVYFDENLETRQFKSLFPNRGRMRRSKEQQYRQDQEEGDEDEEDEEDEEAMLAFKMIKPNPTPGSMPTISRAIVPPVEKPSRQEKPASGIPKQCQFMDGELGHIDEEDEDEDDGALTLLEDDDEYVGGRVDSASLGGPSVQTRRRGRSEVEPDNSSDQVFTRSKKSWVQPIRHGKYGANNPAKKKQRKEEEAEEDRSDIVTISPRSPKRTSPPFKAPVAYPKIYPSGAKQQKNLFKFSPEDPSAQKSHSEPAGAPTMSDLLFSATSPENSNALLALLRAQAETQNNNVNNNANNLSQIPLINQLLGGPLPPLQWPMLPVSQLLQSPLLLQNSMSSNHPQQATADNGYVPTTSQSSPVQQVPQQHSNGAATNNNANNPPQPQASRRIEFCMYCGEKYPEQALFCPFCGSKRVFQLE